MFFNNLLSLAIWVPILAGVLVLATGTDSRAPLARILALIGAVAGFLVTLPLFTHFDRANAGYQFTELHAWIPALNLNYALGVDGISVLFVILNAFITLMVVLAGWEVIQKRPAQYMAAFLIMSGLINGAFAAQDAILFYVFFEAMLIPLYLIVGMWGGPRRVYAAMKLFLYTLLGSLLMLVALIYLGAQANSFAITDLQNLKQIPMGVQQLVFIAFFLSFAVKVPMFPVHTWLPDAHVEAPTGGSMVLAAITLKIGAYGFLRFVLPIVPDASRYFAPVIIVLSLIAVIYIGMVALVQTDMKKLVAYSSISHMGFVTLGIFLFSGMFSGQLGELNDWGLKGAIVQMISHGFVSAAMFMCIGVMYDRLHTRNIADYGGVVNVMPKFAAFMMLFGMANAGLPATSGFVGEFMVIMGAVEVNLWIGALAALTLIYGASYTLWMYKRTIFGEITNPHVAEMKDINCREFAILAILAAAVLGMGLYPEAFIAVVHQAADNLIAQVAQSKI
ncbi:NADH-quinone oxidoreductase subunit M [Kingella kingae]|uniref:NADH-quinone oxidoreductase subunit M n=1 Tax=Kingella kingae TaxID=504 RepID=UPI0002DC8281|nr:NADH-quinone oxidoreductase subunit M [Kingella kingae]MDK4544640.1 NADH-quinone oxidoreductase subunit M [Kingella kingae]MDK4555437.1 NADH-quinone oxidoreductase subunit M [Kingella kingae]MDK4566660.1 NADH-quinone oxidoreductase subunit M [Kingella kingae]MDK4576414.1 NADH-quinone oxidoreductase subunit M [Kingella kingae]MDK4582476.1 NADH-quinone oxidoreductase subunit M [Kingella kingae]